MGASLGNRNKGRGRRGGAGAMTDINMTPMIDVMLVLLIVFMVTAPMMTAGIPVDLPKTQATTQSNDQTEPLVLTVTKNDEVYLQETKVPVEAVIERLKAITAANPDQRIFIRGDKDINYGKVVTLMGQLTAAGFNRVALVAESQP
jgi:biopolymer transport protein TolR